MPAYPDLKDRVVLLTGGANGIGAATVRAFHHQQARVWFCDLDAGAGRALAGELGKRVEFQRVDLSNERAIERWMGSVSRRAGRIDVVVNNAAIDPRMPLAGTKGGFLDRVLGTNLKPLFTTSRCAAPYMPAGGSIINLASVTVHAGPPDMTAYVATKGAVLGFTRSLARELGSRRIRVNAVSPGWIMTERQLRMYVTAAVRKLIRKSQCIPDLLQPEDMAEVILFLASDASRAVTGQEILADRGWYHS